MRRLLVSTSNASTYARIASRLRGAEVAWDEGRPPTEPFAEGFDAVAFPHPNGDTPAGLALAHRAGKHMLLFDPWGVQEQAVTRMFAMARAAGLRFVVANYERYLPSRRLIHQELAAGKCGRAGLVRIHCWWELGMPFRLHHELDVAIWLMGARPDVVYACGGDAGIAAYQQVHLGFAGGGMALIDYCTHLPNGSLWHRSLHVIGSAGAAYADDHDQAQLVFGGGVPRAPRRHEGLDFRGPSIVQDFVDGAPAEAGLAMSHTQWHYVRATAAAVQESLATRQAVRVEAA